MSDLNINLLEFSSAPGKPILILAPSLGTSVEGLWSPCAELLGDGFHIIGWDLPGHGSSDSSQLTPFTVADLAEGVRRALQPVLASRGRRSETIFYAGVSLGGAVGLQWMVDEAQAFSRASVLCTGAMIGQPATWQQRADQVRQHGTASIVDRSRQQWFASGLDDHNDDRSNVLLDDLRATDDEAYALACEALASFDVRDRLGDITVPILAIAGDKDSITTTSDLKRIATEVTDGRLVVLDNVAHLAPAEAPRMTAHLLAAHLTEPEPEVADPYDSGMSVRRTVLGDTHVDRATTSATDFTRDFQEFVTKYAWGEIWTRPGLDRRSRSMITLTAMIARGHHDELAMHLRAALTNGLTVNEIKEVLLQSAIYCGVPDANTAFTIAQEVLTNTRAP